MLFKNKSEGYLKVPFAQLEQGDTFITDVNSSEVLIKTTTMRSPFSGLMMNTVKLTNGGHTQTREADVVFPVTIQEVDFTLGRVK